MPLIIRRLAMLVAATATSFLVLAGLRWLPPAAAAPAPDAPSCTGGTTPLTLWSDDLEMGDGAWQSGGLTNTWNLSRFRVHEGMFSLHAANLSSISDQWTQMPAVVLPPAGLAPLELSFWNYQAMEDNFNGCFDGGLVELSLNGGVTWQTFSQTQLLTDPYDGLIDQNFGNPLAGQRAWCGDPQDWLESIVDLSPYAGETVTLRFRLGSDESNGREGWYIDTVAVNACLPASGYGARLSPALSQQTLVPGATVTHSFLLENLGAADTYNVAVSGALWATDLTSAASVPVGAGSTTTITVRVGAPAAVGTDSFALMVASANDPSHVQMMATGRTDARQGVYVPVISRP